MSMSLVHRWVGGVLCSMMLLISVTGTLLVWKPEYLWLTIPSARATVDRDINRIALAVEKIEASYQAGEVRFVQLYSEDLAIHKIFLTEQRYAWHNQSGEQLQVWKGNERWEDWLLDLHHRFLLDKRVGLNTVGFTGLLLMPLAIVGSIIWWPDRRFFKLNVKPKSSKHGAWMHSHSNLGVLSLVPILVLAFSGVVLVYPAESRWLLIGGFDKPQPTRMSSEASDVKLGWLTVLKHARDRFPGSTLRWLSPAEVDPSSGQEIVVKVGLQQVNEWNRTGSTSIRFTDKKLQIRDGFQQSIAKRSIDFTYPIHTGKLGFFYRLLLTLFGLLITGLGILGLVSVTKRYRLK